MKFTIWSWFIGVWGIIAIVCVQVAVADTYTFHDGFDGGFADGNWTYLNRTNWTSDSGYTFANGEWEHNLLGVVQAQTLTVYNGMPLLLRGMPANFNWTEINVTVVFDVEPLNWLHAGIYVTNFGNDELPNLMVAAGRTSESYENYFFVDTVPSFVKAVDDYAIHDYGDSGEGIAWNNHSLRVQIINLWNGSYEVNSYASYYEYGLFDVWNEVYSEDTYDVSYFPNLALGIGERTTIYADSSYTIPYKDFWIEATGSYLAEELPEEEAAFGNISVVLISPANDSLLTSHLTHFVWSTNVTANCTIDLNSVPNTTVMSNDVYLYIADTALMTWRVNCTTDNVTGGTGFWQFVVNTTPYTDDAGIAVSLVSPVNGSVETSNTVSFDYSANVSSNCSLWLNGVNNVTQESGTPFSRYVADAESASWQVLCSATYVQGNSDTWYFKVNTTALSGIAEVCPEPLSDLAMRALLTVTILLLFLLFGVSYLKGRR